MVFPLHKPYPYSYYRWVPPFYVPEMFGESRFIHSQQTSKNSPLDLLNQKKQKKQIPMPRPRGNKLLSLKLTARTWKWMVGILTPPEVRYDWTTKTYLKHQQKQIWLNQPTWKICSSEWLHLPQGSRSLKVLFSPHPRSRSQRNPCALMIPVRCSPVGVP